MWIIVGLGNPGAAYAATRHNVGFLAVDALARRWNVELRAGAAARVGRGVVAGTPSVLLQPLTYMNRSGDALREIPAEPGELMVVYDDLDLPVGQLRLRARGGSGGHRGVASIVEQIGGEFARVRIGIGRPPAGMEVADYVLSAPSAADEPVLHGAIVRACEAIECVLGDGIDTAMSRFNVRHAAERTESDDCEE